MLVESNPLHKKKKRLKKKRSQKNLEQKKANADVIDDKEQESDEDELKKIEKHFIPYNRERWGLCCTKIAQILNLKKNRIFVILAVLRRCVEQVAQPLATLCLI